MIWANVTKFGYNFIAPPNFFGLLRLCVRETGSQENLTYEVIHGTFMTKHKGNKKGLSQPNFHCTILSDKFMTNI